MALSSTLGKGQVLPLDQETVGDNWPLISFLMADEVYHQTYVEYVEKVIDGAFDPQTMAETYQRYHDMIEPYVSAEDAGTGAANMRGSGSTFETSVEELIAHVNGRYAEAQDYLASQQ
jgi:hypothetical protein